MAPPNFKILHRNLLFAIENHFSLVKWPPTFEKFLPCMHLVSSSQTITGMRKGSGISNSKFLVRLPPKLGWGMIGDEATS